MKCLKHPILGLFGLCLSLFALPITAHAGAFPYFGPDPDQETMIAQGFFHADNIIQIISSPGGALFYLALTGALIGFFLILTRPTMRSPVNLFSWLIVILVLLVTPVGSPLLFTNFAVKDLTANNPNIPQEVGQAKAFTPQAGALHVMSTIHEILLTYFRSTGFKDRVGEVMATQQFCAGSNMTLDDETFNRFNTLVNNQSCLTPVVGADFQATAMQQSGFDPNDVSELQENEIAQRFNIRTFGEVIGAIQAYYQRGDTSQPPPTAILYTSTNQLPPGFDQDGYVRGLETLHRELNGKAATDALIAETFANADVQMQALVEGIFSHSTFTNANNCSGGNCNASLGLPFFLAEGREGANGNVVASPESAAVKGRTQRGGLSSRFVEPYKLTGQFDEIGQEQLKYFSPNTRPQLAKIFDMPVGIASLDQSNNSITTISDCSAEADAIFNDVADQVTANLSGQARRLLKGDLAEAPEAMSIAEARNTAGDIADAGPALIKMTLFRGRNDLAARFTKMYNYIKAHNPYDSDEEIIAKFQNAVAFCAMSTTAERNAEAEREEAIANGTAVDTELTPTAFVGLWDSTAGGWLARAGVGLTKFILDKFVYIVGFLAILVIEFIQILVNMALMGIIVITPFIMLMGLVMPSYAFGIIAFSVGSVFVLKMVPVTFLIVDVIISRLFEIMGGWS